jgi:hypothetical protein
LVRRIADSAMLPVGGVEMLGIPGIADEHEVILVLDSHHSDKLEVGDDVGAARSGVFDQIFLGPIHRIGCDVIIVRPDAPAGDTLGQRWLDVLARDDISDHHKDLAARVVTHVVHLTVLFYLRFSDFCYLTIESRYTKP